MEKSHVTFNIEIQMDFEMVIFIVNSYFIIKPLTYIIKYDIEGGVKREKVVQKSVFYRIIAFVKKTSILFRSFIHLYVEYNLVLFFF